jgi:ubiquinone/menaquinone biosynthesis C-methylase UbiE
MQPAITIADAPRGDLRRRIAALDADMRRHDWVVAKMSLATMTWIPAERARLLRSLGVAPGQTVLDHCTGPGSNLPMLAAALCGTGRLVAMDLSGLVVRQARTLAARLGIDAEVQQADASALPYADDTFDVVVHYGALNQFDDQRAAVDEIVRVTRPDGLVVLLDEGLEPRRRDSWWGRLLIWGNPLFAACPPLHLVPPGATADVRWVIRGMFYEIRFRKPRA